MGGGRSSQAVLALADPGQVLRLLAWMESADDFLSPFGLRSLSRFHRDEPLEMELGSQLRIAYEPGPARSGMLSGNVGHYGQCRPCSTGCFTTRSPGWANARTRSADGAARSRSGCEPGC